jgi:hypothetical protein
LFFRQKSNPTNVQKIPAKIIVQVFDFFEFSLAMDDSFLTGKSIGFRSALLQDVSIRWNSRFVLGLPVIICVSSIGLDLRGQPLRRRGSLR